MALAHWKGMMDGMFTPGPQAYALVLREFGTPAAPGQRASPAVADRSQRGHIHAAPEFVRSPAGEPSTQ